MEGFKLGKKKDSEILKPENQDTKNNGSLTEEI